MRILTTNRHTPYLYLLARTGFTFLVLGGWEGSQRPLPQNVALVGRRLPPCELILGHGLADLFPLGLLALRRRLPYVQVLHGRLERARGLRRLAKRLIARGVLAWLARAGRVQVVGISETVLASWRLPGRVVRPGVPLEELGPYEGDWPILLVVGNDLHRSHFDQAALVQLQAALPVSIIGRNPHLPRAYPAESWEDLKAIYARHRAYVNLLREPEDGYNLATLEAMGTGMPVLTLRHPTSPVEDGLNGFGAEDAEGLIRWGRVLLGNGALARILGERARQTVAERFPMDAFVEAWRAVLEHAAS